jgi:N-acyl-D-aspartate/D-glutamate deacylase
VLKAGWYADIVVFDPKTVGSGPVHMRPDLPCNEPRIYADAYGVDHVFVNGVQIIRNGEHTHAMPGKALRSGKDTYTPVMAKGHAR